MIFIKGNKKIEYEIIIKRNKNAYFRIENQKVIISTGLYIANEKILKVLDENFDKFYDLIEKSRTYNSPNHLMLFGKKYLISLINGKTNNYYFDHDKIFIQIKNPKDLEKYIDQIYQMELRKKIVELNQIMEPNLKAHKLYLVPTHIKKYKSRFGVCDVINKEITINLFLAKIDPSYLLYVLYHEYSHLRVPNHSKEFYLLLSKLFPNYLIIRKELKMIAIN